MRTPLRVQKQRARSVQASLISGALVLVCVFERMPTIIQRSFRKASWPCCVHCPAFLEATCSQMSHEECRQPILSYSVNTHPKSPVAVPVTSPTPV